MNTYLTSGADSLKASYQILFCVSVLWVVVVGCSAFSVFSQPFSKKQRAFWMFVILAFPLVGLLSYLPFSIKKENYPGLFNLKNNS